VQRVLKPTGTFWLAIGDEYAAELKLIFQKELASPAGAGDLVLHVRVNCTKKFSRSHAHLFYFVKDAKHFTFNEDAIAFPRPGNLSTRRSRKC